MPNDQITDCMIPKTFEGLLYNVLLDCFGENWKDKITNYYLNGSTTRTTLNPQHITITFFVILMISIGIFGNLMVIYIVLYNKSMRQSPRNLFILNLAISDLTFCALTQPMNIVRFTPSEEGWTLGLHVYRLMTVFQGTNIFVSAFSIIAIAVDRYIVIIHAKKRTTPVKYVYRWLFFIWCLAFLLASPIASFSTVVKKNSKYECFEVLSTMKSVYAIGSFLLQFFVPLVTVVYANTKIAMKIRLRTQNIEMLRSRYHINNRPMVNRSGDTNSNPNIANEIPLAETPRMVQQRRMNPKRASILLATIVVAFVISWMPLSLINVILDIRLIILEKTVKKFNFQPQNNNSFLVEHFQSDEVFMIQFGCLLMTLISACMNPILYGWLNENFRDGFKQIYSKMFKRCKCKKKQTENKCEYQLCCFKPHASSCTVKCCGLVQQMSSESSMYDLDHVQVHPDPAVINI